MESTPLCDFYHDHPYHQLNIAHEVEVVHEELPKIYTNNSKHIVFDKEVVDDVIDKGMPIPKEWLDSWQHISVKDLKPHVDLDLLFKNWHATLPIIEKERTIPNLLSRRSKDSSSITNTINTGLRSPTMPDLKAAKQWEIKCTLCNKVLRGGNQRYEAHLKNSHHVLCICGQQFQFKINLQTHIKKEQNNGLHGYLPGEVVTPMFECDYCDESFRTCSLAEKHRHLVHGELVKKVSRTMVYTCRPCKQTFPDRKSLLLHNASMECSSLQNKKWKYFCGICNKDCYCKKTCKDHLKAVHGIKSRGENYIKHFKEKQSFLETMKGRTFSECDSTSEDCLSNDNQYNNNNNDLLEDDTVHQTHTKAGSVIYYSLSRL